LAHALDVAEQFGVRAVELRGVWGKSILEQPDDIVAQAKELLQSRGFSVASVASGFFKCDLPGYGATAGDVAAAQATVARHIAMLRRGVELCRVFGAPVIRGFAFWRPLRQSAGLQREPGGQTNRHLREADLPPEVLQQMLAAFAEPIRIVESSGATFGLENEHGCGVGRGDETARFIEALGSSSFRVAWDPGNAFFAGEVSYPRGYDAVRPYVAHVHVKDAVVDPSTGQAHWCRLGAGEIDWLGQFRALIEDGYGGALSLETHYTPPGGTREEGSRECLAAMMELLRRAGWRG
jgi:sugar phosphate isomerase/epimerase